MKIARIPLSFMISVILSVRALGQTPDVPAVVNSNPINVVAVGYDIAANTNAQTMLQNVAKAARDDGVTGEVILADQGEPQLDAAMSRAMTIATAAPEPPPEPEAPVPPPEPEYRLELLTPSVAPGDRIAVVHSDFPVENTNAWIAFYEKSDDRAEDYISYTFLANLMDRVYDVTAPDRTGGEYHFRLFLDPQYTEAARSGPVAVGGAPGVADGGGAPGSGASAHIGPEGGELLNQSAGIKVVVPSGALTKPVRLSVSPVANPATVFATPLPAALAQAVHLGPAFDLGPSGTRFQKPVRVSVPCPEDVLTEAKERSAFAEAGYFDGKEWRSVRWSRLDLEKGEIQFETDHLSLFVPIVIFEVAGGVVLLEAMRWNAVWAHPNVMITPDRIPREHTDRITLPSGPITTPVKLVPCGFRKFVPRTGRLSPWWVPRIFPANGETMLTQDDANCWDACNYAASALLAKGDRRFTDFKVVSGKMTTTGKDKETGDHAWIEIRIDGKIYVIDTAQPDDLQIIPKDEAYKKYTLVADEEWTNLPRSKRKYQEWANSASNSVSNSVVLLIDASLSMNDNGKIGAAKATAKQQVDRMKPDTELAVISFNQDQGPHLDASFAVMDKAGQVKLAAAIDGISTGSGTPLAAGIRYAGSYLRSSASGKKLTLVILSDGEENCGGDPAAETAALNAQGVEVRRGAGE